MSENHSQAMKHWNKICYFAVTIMPADGLAPNGAKPSAGIVMTKFRSCINAAYKG